MLWDLTDAKRLYTLEAGDIIHALCFSPNRYWLCAATQSCIKVRSALKLRRASGEQPVGSSQLLLCSEAGQAGRCQSVVAAPSLCTTWEQ